METESSHYMCGTITFLTLFAQNYIFEHESILSRSCTPVSRSIFPPKYRPMETTPGLVVGNNCRRDIKWSGSTYLVIKKSNICCYSVCLLSFVLQTMSLQNVLFNFPITSIGKLLRNRGNVQTNEIEFTSKTLQCHSCSCFINCKERFNEKQA